MYWQLWIDGKAQAGCLLAGASSELVDSTRTANVISPYEILLAFVCAMYLADRHESKDYSGRVELLQFDGESTPVVIASYKSGC